MIQRMASDCRNLGFVGFSPRSEIFIRERVTKANCVQGWLEACGRFGCLLILLSTVQVKVFPLENNGRLGSECIAEGKAVSYEMNGIPQIRAWGWEIWGATGNQRKNFVTESLESMNTNRFLCLLNPRGKTSFGKNNWGRFLLWGRKALWAGGKMVACSIE